MSKVTTGINIAEFVDRAEKIVKENAEIMKNVGHQKGTQSPEYSRYYTGMKNLLARYLEELTPAQSNTASGSNLTAGLYNLFKQENANNRKESVAPQSQTSDTTPEQTDAARHGRPKAVARSPR